MKKVLKKTVGLLMAVMIIGSMLICSVSAAEAPQALTAEERLALLVAAEVEYANLLFVDCAYYVSVAAAK